MPIFKIRDFHEVKIHILVFWVMTLCGLVGGNSVLDEHNCLHLQGRSNQSWESVRPYRTGLAIQGQGWDLGWANENCRPWKKRLLQDMQKKG
jgi:hypothetical protein